MIIKFMVNVRRMDSIKWGVFVIILHIYKYYIIAFISLGEEVKRPNDVIIHFI